ncbi:hypothetical protein RB653_008193 [Dictyostelium firmibasis]|uniref:Uncharacterized protein n=1 Tax=Dictyostelium firmibasis TaxID=79012 RepID=A0AAN7YQY2_9MYCE
MMMLNNQIKFTTNIVGFSKRFYSSTLSKKKILISGNDVVGLSLALFLKKKGISSEIVESNHSKLNDTGIILTHKNLQAYKDYVGENLLERIINNGNKLNGSGYFAKNGDAYGNLNFSKYSKSNDDITLLSTTESKLKEILTHECLKSLKDGEGIVTFKKSIFKIKKVHEENKENNSNNNDKNEIDNSNNIYLTFTNSTNKNYYDLIIGSMDPTEKNNIDPIREYVIEKNTPQFIEPSIYKQRIEQTYSFNTIVDCNFSLVPPLLITQFLKGKKLVSFLLPNKKVALTGTFTRETQITVEPSKYNQLVSSVFKQIEDVNVHSIVSLYDNQNELNLFKVPQTHLTNITHNSIVLIGNTADYLPHDNVFITSIGIEDANKLTQLLIENNNNNNNNNNTSNIQTLLSKFNDDRKIRLAKFMKFIKKDHNIIFNSGKVFFIIGKYYLKFHYFSKKQYNHFKDLLF